MGFFPSRSRVILTISGSSTRIGVSSGGANLGPSTPEGLGCGDVKGPCGSRRGKLPGGTVPSGETPTSAGETLAGAPPGRHLHRA